MRVATKRRSRKRCAKERNDRILFFVRGLVKRKNFAPKLAQLSLEPRHFVPFLRETLTADVLGNTADERF